MTDISKLYNRNYFFADRYGGRLYRDRDGRIKEFGYFAGGLWDYEGILAKLIELLGKPESVLDLGAGCGGWVATCRKHGIRADGIEFSRYAVEKAWEMWGVNLIEWDLSKTPWPVKGTYTWLTVIDTFEHLFEDTVDNVIAECKRLAERYIIAKICSARSAREVWSAKRGSLEDVMAQARREGFEWLVVSGHLTSRLPEWWLRRLEDAEWKQRWDLVERFRGELNLPDDWRLTVMLERGGKG